MRMVLKAKKETPNATPLPYKIKAKAVFEGQEARAERCSQPEKSIVAHFSLAQDPRTAGTAHAPLEEPSTEKPLPPLRTSSTSPTRETSGKRSRATPHQCLSKMPGPTSTRWNNLRRNSAGYVQGQHRPGVWCQEGCPGTGP